jgi:predicted dehydrogenase
MASVPSDSDSNAGVTRRDFVKTSTAAAVGIAGFPAFIRAQRSHSPNDKLNIASLGPGGAGFGVVRDAKDENIVALCDVDAERAGNQFKRDVERDPNANLHYRNAPMFDDYRKMFDKMANQIDAVSVGIPDHAHFPAAMAALALGKHVFVQKPLTHTIWEARTLARTAREKGVMSQMGNQGHTYEGCRVLKEWVDSGVLGEVREVHSWTNRPVWAHVKGPVDHSKMIPVVPSTLNWDAWLCSSAAREYDPTYLPFVWRDWWDFGTGALGDMGCHVMDGSYYALGLTAPTAIEASSSGCNEHGAPTSSVVTYYFPARGKMPPVKYTWSDGNLLPCLPPEFEMGRKLPAGSGTFIYGSKAIVLTDEYNQSMRIIPETKMAEMASSLPPKTIPRVEGGPVLEWIRAIKGGPKAGSNFDYSGPLSEVILLGNIALRVGRRIEWDAENMVITNIPEANRYIKKEYRPGWF